MLPSTKAAMHRFSEQPHLVLFDNLPTSCRRGVGGHALVYHVGGTTEEGAVAEVGMTRNPACRE